MALTWPRWIALALTGLFVAPVLVLHDDDRREWQPTERDRLMDRERLARAHVVAAANQLRILQIRDSVEQRARSIGHGDYAVDAAFDSATRALLHELGRDVRANRAAAPRVPTSIFFVLDTVTVVRGQPRRPGFVGAMTLHYVLPGDSSGHCLVLARLKPTPRQAAYEAELRSAVTRDRLLGPCAFVERFGVPGRAIADWLGRRGWQFAQRGAFETASAPWLDGTSAEDYRDRINLEMAMAPIGRACAAGKSDSCLQALLEQQRAERRRMWLTMSAGVLSTGFYNPFVHGDRAWLTSSLPFGAREWTLLSDMVRSLGFERFERFWTSNLPPEQAFRSATDVTLAHWTQQWVRSTYHSQPVGPALSAGATGFAALLLAVGTLLSIVAARRRQVS